MVSKKKSVDQAIVPVILAGGIGSRLWPLSRQLYPKQVLSLLGEKSLLQETIARAIEVTQSNRVIITCNQENQFLVKEQLSLFSDAEIIFDLVLEPCGRNTAAAIALASLHQLQIAEESLLLVLPADHILSDMQAFSESISFAAAQARFGKLVTFGIVPTYPEPDYGYIEYQPSDDAHHYQICSFVEKPSLSLAKEFIATERYFWNSGMFLLQAKIYLSELAKYNPNVYECISAAYAKHSVAAGCIQIDDELFSATPDISIDHAVMEHTQLGVVVPLNTVWNDIGSWDKLFAAENKDDDNNVLIGDVVTNNVCGAYIRAESRKVAAIDINDCVIVETADAVLVSSQSGSKKVKHIVKQLQLDQSPQVVAHTRVHRPWGYYEVLVDAPAYKVKLIYVHAKAQLSLQSHQYRHEHWVVVEGTALITREQETFTLCENESTFIPATVKHQIANSSGLPLSIIEVQVGTYLGEDDIVRYTDKYGRKVNPVDRQAAVLNELKQ